MMDFLRIKNGKVVAQDNQPVYLRGVNIGGWMNMEHFLTGHPGAESNLRRLMCQAMDKEKAAFFFDRFLYHFFDEQDVIFLKGVGITAIRLPINYRHFESDLAPFEYLEAGFERLEQVIKWCEKHGMYIILDLHSVQGWQNGDWHCDNSSRHALFWIQKQSQDRFVAFWQEFARRYRDRAVIAAYNIMNEPLSNAPYGRFAPDNDYQPDWENINNIYRRTVNAIREIDSDHIIIVEGDYYSTSFEGLEAPFDAHLMYSNHNYIEPAVGQVTSYPVTLGDTYWDKQYIQKQFTETQGYVFAQTHNVPLLVGEFGLNMDYPADNVCHKVAVFSDQMQVYNELGVHWTFWSYKALGSMGWVQTHPESLYMQTIAPVLRAKDVLSVDFGWLSGFQPAIQPHIEALSAEIGAHIPGIDHGANFRYFGQAAMSTYTADQLQNVYVQQFVDKSETEIDDILASFSLSNCVERVEMSEAIRRATIDS
jgi:endoglucanase